MKVFNDPRTLRAHLTDTVATIGNFDGVHRGHQAILARLRERAAARGGATLLVTFDPHPLKVLAPDRAPRMICTPRQKHALLEAARLDYLVVLPFTSELAAVTAEGFVRDWLAGGLGVQEVHVGANFNFGRGREGNADLLVTLCAAAGMQAGKVDEVLSLGSPISSSRIRRAVISGEVELAGDLLGRPFALEGTVVHGDARGATLGIPTANLATGNELVPQDGVYVTEAVVDGRPLPAVTNIGSRPTFAGAHYAIETHVLGDPGDLYDRPLEIRFRARLRQELRFDSVQSLIDQVRRDIARARAWFADAGRAAT
jgi:riboflavin kinase/FMN adenylyltransferase